MKCQIHLTAPQASIARKETFLTKKKDCRNHSVALMWRTLLQKKKKSNNSWPTTARRYKAAFILTKFNNY